MAEHGGYRRPEHPAPVSGPGALSARTDGGATTQPPMVAAGGPYGSRKDQMDVQGGAALQGGGGPTPPPANLVPLDAPSANPQEPVTAGADQGAGIGPQAAGIQTDSQASLEQMKPLLTSLETLANLPSATAETRTFVRALKAKLGG